MSRPMLARADRTRRMTSHHLRKNAGEALPSAEFLASDSGAYAGFRAPTAPTSFYTLCGRSEQEWMEDALDRVLAVKQAVHGADLSLTFPTPTT